MRKQGAGGSIVNTASIAGKQGYGFLMQYCASKFAVVGMTQAGAKEMAKDRIRVNAICPGVVDTHMWKVIDQGFQNARLTQNEGDSFKQAAAQALLGRPSTPEDLVGVACFLASRNSEFITGQSIVVDGGIVFS
jgi:meso-butanediol dehydrogenase/(S,S)-butanediol dehydrogenase/diacetyl reductase